MARVYHSEGSPPQSRTAPETDVAPPWSGCKAIRSRAAAVVRLSSPREERVSHGVVDRERGANRNVSCARILCEGRSADILRCVAGLAAVDVWYAVRVHAAEHRAARPDRRSWKWRVLVWSGLLGVASFVALGIVSLTWRYVVLTPGDGRFGLTVIGGALGVSWDGRPTTTILVRVVDFDDKMTRESVWTTYGLRPVWGFSPTYWYVTVPLWLLVCVASLSCFGFRHLNRRRPPLGACACGYDLTGNTSGVCPECGSPKAARVS